MVTGTLAEIISNNIRKILDQGEELSKEEQIHKIELEIAINNLVNNISTKEELEWCIEVLELAQANKLKNFIDRIIYKKE